LTELIDPKRLGQAIFDALDIKVNDEILVQRDLSNPSRVMVVKTR
jgi:hypothetical protein